MTVSAAFKEQALEIVDECIAHLCKGEQYRDPRMTAIEADYVKALTEPLKVLQGKFFRLAFGVGPDDAVVEKQLPPFDFDGLSDDEQDLVYQWFEEWYEAEKAAALQFPRAAYDIGKTTAAGQLGLRTAWFSDIDKAAVQGVADENLRLITRDAGRLIDDVRRHLKSGIERGINPIQIAREMRRDKVFEKVGNNLDLIARDQVAKAQNRGRDTEFRQNGVVRVRISVAPDACPICKPWADRSVEINDTMSRPQYHITCRCSEVPEESFAFKELYDGSGEELPPVRLIDETAPDWEYEQEIKLGPSRTTRRKMSVYEPQTTGLSYRVRVDQQPPPFDGVAPKRNLALSGFEWNPRELKSLADDLLIVNPYSTTMNERGELVWVPAAAHTKGRRVVIFGAPAEHADDLTLKFYQKKSSHELAELDWGRMDAGSKRRYTSLHNDTISGKIRDIEVPPYGMRDAKEDYCESMAEFLQDPKKFLHSKRGEFIRKRFGW